MAAFSLSFNQFWPVFHLRLLSSFPVFSQGMETSVLLAPSLRRTCGSRALSLPLRGRPLGLPEPLQAGLWGQAHYTHCGEISCNLAHGCRETSGLQRPDRGLCVMRGAVFSHVGAKVSATTEQPPVIARRSVRDVSQRGRMECCS